MSALLKQMLQAAILLTIFAVLSGGLVAFMFEITHQRIEANKRAALLSTLNAIVHKNQYDNDFFNDFREVYSEVWLGTNEPVIVYRARKLDQPIAAVLTPIVPDGYNGNINLLVGIAYEGTLLGVRVTSHQETPGLGNQIELRYSNWILNFYGHSLTNTQETEWNIKRDGGIFDQFTGATITPRAIVKAVHKTLQYYSRYRDEIFAIELPSKSISTTRLDSSVRSRSMRPDVLAINNRFR